MTNEPKKKTAVQSAVDNVKANPKKFLMILALLAGLLAPQYQPTIDAISQYLGISDQITATTEVSK